MGEDGHYQQRLALVSTHAESRTGVGHTRAMNLTSLLGRVDHFRLMVGVRCPHSTRMVVFEAQRIVVGKVEK
jgi:hypothetical protein